MKITEADGELPIKVTDGQVFSISKDQTPFVTHNLYRYPTKYIPEIPRWAIHKYTSPEGIVMDPFCGSGTTNLEASLEGHPNFGFDVNPFSVLLARVKNTPLSPARITEAREIFTNLLSTIGFNKTSEDPVCSEPALPNLEHWFPRENVQQLSCFKAGILDVDNVELREFFWIVFARVLKRCSFSDDQSPKPYVSTKHPKIPGNPREELQKSFEFCLAAKEELSKVIPECLSKFGVRNSVQEKENTSIFSFQSNPAEFQEFRGKIDLAVTSPPYINAFDLVRTFKIELYWLDFLRNPSEANAFKREFLGTEKIAAETYQTPVEPLEIPELDEKIRQIWTKDRLRGHVVARFFRDYETHFDFMRASLRSGGRYVIVIGDSKIRGITIKSAQLLGLLAEKHSFSQELYFSYLIRDRYLRIPRQNRGGNIKYDRILVLSRD